MSVRMPDRALRCLSSRKCELVMIVLTLIGIYIIHEKTSYRIKYVYVYFPDVYRLSKNNGNYGHEGTELRSWFPRQPPKRQACVHPKLTTEETSKWKRKESGIKCAQKFDWVFTKGGHFYVNSEAVEKHGQIQCDYTPIFKSQADDMMYGDVYKDFKNNTELLSDSFKIECQASDMSTYANVHSGIKIRHDVLKARTSRFNKDGMGVSILMYGIDSLSRPMYQVQLPKTHDYFVNKLGGRLLEGYNIVGDGTTQALSPILTGQEESELPETRRGYTGAQNVDVYPFIWKQFEKEGFITQWCEDEPYLGAFFYRLLGFREQPVHHYMRPFYIAAKKYITPNDEYCLGSVPRYKLGLNSLKEAFSAYKGTGLFAFYMHAEMSHHDNNKAQTMDDGNLEFLKFMENEGYLNTTILILFSDHGARFGEMRATERGKIEERMPYVGFLFPSWFKSKYPMEMDNFKTNTQRLSTPYDIHATLIHSLYHRKPTLGDVNNIGISLFDEIPPERTCAHARVQPHWCACMKWTPVSRYGTEALDAADTVIKNMNEMLNPYSDLCYELKLGSIKSAAKYLVNNDLLQFVRSQDLHGRVPEFSDSMKTLEELYRITFVTDPGGGLFEATVKRNLHVQLYTVDAKDISRLNMYGDQPYCIQSQVPHLRPYCLCKDTDKQ